MAAQSHVVIVGAGIIGAATAWRCSQRGLDVTLVDPEPSRGAWHTAAGMLAPLTEAEFTETPLLRLNLDSLARYPSFVAEVADETGLPTGYRDDGTLETAWDGADLAALRDIHEFLDELGLKSELLNAREVRSLEPALAAGIPGGLLAADDHQADPRLLHPALLAAARARGVRVVADEAALIVDGDRATGVTLRDGTTLAADQVVLAAGAWSGQVAGLPPEVAPPVRPVKGQTLVVRGDVPLTRVIRGRVRGSFSYLAPRADGRIVVGASVEEAGFDQHPRTGAVYEILRDAQTLLPELSETMLEDVSTGLRPGTIDNAPIIGPSALDGLVFATGHYRNGILLTPVTADAIADHLADGALPAIAQPFTMARFQ